MAEQFDPIIRFRDVLKLTALSRSKVRELISCKAFPQPIPLGGRAIGFLQSELIEWQQQQARKREKR